MTFDDQKQKDDVLAIFGMVGLNAGAPSSELLRFVRLKQAVEDADVLRVPQNTPDEFAQCDIAT